MAEESIIDIGNKAVAVGEEAIRIGIIVAKVNNDPTGREAIKAGEAAVTAGLAIVGDQAGSLVCGGKDLQDRLIEMVADAGEAASSFIQYQILQAQKLLLEAAKLQELLKQQALAAIAQVQAILAEAGAGIASFISDLKGEAASLSQAVLLEVGGMLESWLPAIPDFGAVELPDLVGLLPNIGIDDIPDLGEVAGLANDVANLSCE